MASKKKKLKKSRGNTNKGTNRRGGAFLKSLKKGREISKGNDLKGNQ